MLVDSAKLVGILLALLLVLILERMFGLPVWFGFCLWLLGRQRHSGLTFTALWVVSSLSLAVLYQLAFSWGFLITLLPLTVFYHRSWWKSQTLAVLGSVMGPMMLLAMLTKIGWTWPLTFYLIGSFITMIFLLNTWLIEHRQLAGGKLKIEWQRIERLREG